MGFVWFFFSCGLPFQSRADETQQGKSRAGHVPKQAELGSSRCSAHIRLGSGLGGGSTTIPALEWEYGAGDFKILLSFSSWQAAVAEHFPGQVIQQVSRGFRSGVRSR